MVGLKRVLGRLEGHDVQYFDDAVNFLELIKIRDFNLSFSQLIMMEM